MKCEQKITAEYTWSDEPLETNKVDGLNEAIEAVADDHEKKILVRCDDRVADYDVYWNDGTDAVRVAAVALGASYEVPTEHNPGLDAFGEGDA